MKGRPSIRPAHRDDAMGILAVYGPVVSETPISFEEEPPSLKEIEERIATSFTWLVAEIPDELLGYAYASALHPRAAYRWSTEVSVYLGSGARGRGIGTQLLKALLERLREIGFVNAFAGVTLPNPASIRLFESAGFGKIAHWDQVGFKLGAWHDVGWWQLRLQDATVPPPSLTPRP